MFEILQKFIKILGKDKDILIFYIFLYTVKTIIEVFSISLLIPLFNFLFNPNLFEKINNKINILFSLNLNSDEGISVIIILFIILYFLKSSLELLIIYLNTKFIVTQQASLRVKLFSITQEINYEILLNKSSAELIRNSQHLVNNFTKNVLTPVLQTASDFILAMGLIIFLVLQGNEYVFFIIFTSLTFIGLYKYFLKNTLINYGFKSNDAIKNIISTIQELFKGFKEIRIYNLKKFFTNLIEKNSNRYAKLHLKISILQILPKHILELFVIGILLFVYYDQIVINKTETETLLTGTYVAQIAAIIKLLPFFNKFSSTLVRVRNQKDSLDKLCDELKLDINENNTIKIHDNITNLNNFKSLELKNLSFSYDVKNKVIDNLNLKLNHSQVIGICGPSGSGKSTLIDLITGLIFPNKGEIIINDQLKLNKENCSSWHKFISYVPQESFIINDSVKKNIIIKEDNFILEKFIDTMNFVSLENELNELMQAGELGQNISGGQRKRLGIARAYYSGRPLMILDETLAELDRDNQKKLLTNFKRIKNMTFIIISHDKFVLDQCDKVLNLKSIQS